MAARFLEFRNSGPEASMLAVRRYATDMARARADVHLAARSTVPQVHLGIPRNTYF